MNESSPPVAVGRVVFLIVSLLIFAACGAAAVGLFGFSETIRKLQNPRLLTTSVDLSQLGETAALFHQAETLPHSVEFYVTWESKPESEENSDEFLKDLSGKIVLKQPDGTSIERPQDSRLEQPPVFDFQKQAWFVGRLVHFYGQEYLATIEIENGVPALAGKTQTLFTRHEACGCVSVPLFLISLLVLLIGLFGLIIFLCILPGLYKHGIRQSIPQNPSTEPAVQDAE